MEPLVVIYLCLTVIFLIVCAIILHDKIIDRQERKECRTRTSLPGRATENRQGTMRRQVLDELEGLPDDVTYSQIKAVLDRAAFQTVPDPIWRRALEVFGDEDKAGEWLTTKIAVLGGQTPIDILISTEGEKEVLAILDRIEHGVFS
mgnify:CR=1 FL=1